MSKPLYFSCWGDYYGNRETPVDRKFVQEGRLPFEADYHIIIKGQLKEMLLTNISHRIKTFLRPLR